MLQVIEKEGQLVVDSRLIADELGIEHRSFKRTIDDYKTQTEQAFGILRFENAELNDVGRPEMYYLLTEDQATFLMTLSRNTEQVVKAKINLVTAFSKAKSALLSIKQQAETALNQTILAEVLLRLDNLQIDHERLNQLQAEKDKLAHEREELHTASQIHPGCAEIIADQIDNEDGSTLMTARDFVTETGIAPNLERSIVLLANGYQKCGKSNKKSPKQQGTNRIMIELRYLKKAARLVLGL